MSILASTTVSETVRMGCELEMENILVLALPVDASYFNEVSCSANLLQHEGSR
jgi:hypothetical protein